MDDWKLAVEQMDLNARQFIAVLLNLEPRSRMQDCIDTSSINEIRQFIGVVAFPGCCTET
jgi:hypothetical protein